MVNRPFLLNLTLIFSEVCFLVLLYLCVMGFFQGQLLIGPLYFFLLAGVLTLLNTLLSLKSLRIFTIAFVNLLLIGVFLWLITMLSGLPLGYLFTIPKGLEPALQVILADASLLWLLFRSLYLVYSRRTVNVYTHFDLHILLCLLIFLIIAIARHSLPGGIAWIIIALLLNFLPLYLYNNSGNKSPLTGWIFGGLVVILIFLASKTAPLLSYISEPAGTAFDLIQKVIETLALFFGGLILWFTRLVRGKNVSLSQQESAQQSQGGMGNPEVTGVPWLDTMLTVISWVFLVLGVLIVLLAVFTLLRYLVLQLLKRREGSGRVETSIDLFLPWKTIYRWLRRLMRRVACLCLPFLPFKVTVYEAYRLLLQWGALKHFPRGPEETPYHYCRRLAEKFPAITPELTKLTESFVCHRYSGKGCVAHDPNLKPLIRRIYLEDWYRLRRLLTIRKE